MTPEQQSRADHLALVAATLYTAWRADSDFEASSNAELAAQALDHAEVLQRAAEERVKRE